MGAMQIERIRNRGIFISLNSTYPKALRELDPHRYQPVDETRDTRHQPEGEMLMSKATE